MRLSEGTRLCSAIVGKGVEILADNIAQLESENTKLKRATETLSVEMAQEIVAFFDGIDDEFETAIRAYAEALKESE